jgi:cell wall-associated NlpC family hydrolase
MILGAIKKVGKAVATGNAQSELGIQSPHLPSAMSRLGRFAYITSAGWIGITWYTAYANVHTQAGSGPTLVLPGVNSKNGSGSPSRSDPAVPSFGSGGVNGSGGGSGGPMGIPATTAGPVRTKVIRTALQMVGQTRFRYAPVRPIPANILSNPDITDCSGFVTQVYLTAGAPDPNGFGYAKPLEGSSSAMWGNGTQVKTPQLGDLKIYSDHVVVIVALKPLTCVGFGSPSDPGPVKRTIAQQDSIQAGAGQTILGYRSYI